METFDKGIVLENILPVMYGLKSHEPGVLMGILGILHKTFITPTLGFSKEYVANVLLPYLIPLSMEPKLNVSQVLHY
jgi:SCY1-like protein 2